MSALGSLADNRRIGGHYAVLRDPAQFTRHAVRCLPNGSEDHAELRWLEAFSDMGKAGSLL